MTLELKGKVIAEKTFKVHLNNELPQQASKSIQMDDDAEKIASFWKRRGC